jgi:hypothetical protein
MVEYRQAMTTNELESTYIVVMDANLPSNEAYAVANTLQKLFLNQVHERQQTLKLAFITFGHNVSIYQLGMTAGLASADVLPVDDYHENEEDLVQRRSRMSSRLYFTEIQNEADLATFGSCISAIFGLHVEEETLSRMELLKRKKEARLRATQRATDQ